MPKYENIQELYNKCLFEGYQEFIKYNNQPKNKYYYLKIINNHPKLKYLKTIKDILYYEKKTISPDYGSLKLDLNKLLK